MQQNLAVTLAAFALAAAPLCGQRILSQHLGTPGTALGTLVRAAGDVDLDGTTDLVATEPSTSVPGIVRVGSGATGGELFALIGLASQPLDAVGIGDVDGDGRSDIAVVDNLALRVFAGADGHLLWSLPGGGISFFSVCPVGDFDSNGSADLAVAAYSGGNIQVTVRRGSNGGVLSNVATIANSTGDGTVRAVGDLDGDTRTDLAFVSRGTIHVLSTAPPGSTLWTITPLPAVNSDRVLAAIDLDGDGKSEVLLGRDDLPASSGSNGQIDVYAGTTGLHQLTIVLPFGQNAIGKSICGIGDLDQDGVQDIASGRNQGLYGEVRAFSGRTGAELWSQSGSPTLPGLGFSIADLGDVDGDGFRDLASGCPGRFPGSGWQVVSGRILASVTSQGGACGGGPFLPQLGMTRPFLGQSATVTCRDGAVGVPSALVLSLQPDYPNYLGVSTCTAWFDLDAWSVLALNTQPQWTIPLLVPAAPQLAGIHVALQSFFAPTAGPLGLDLSNGLWAHPGF